MRPRGYIRDRGQIETYEPRGATELMRDYGPSHQLHPQPVNTLSTVPYYSQELSIFQFHFDCKSVIVASWGQSRITNNDFVLILSGWKSKFSKEQTYVCRARVAWAIQDFTR